MKRTLISYLVAILLAFTAGFWAKDKLYPVVCEPDVIEVLVPGVAGTTNTIYLDSIVYKEVDNIVVDSSYYQKYLDALDEKERLAILLEAIKVSEQTVTLIDNDTLKLDVTSGVRGKLLYQFADYEIKEHVMEVPIERDPPTLVQVNGGFFTTFPNDIGLGPKIDFTIREKNIYSIGYDAVGSNIYLAASIKLFKIK